MRSSAKVKYLFALMAFSLTCYAQKPQDATVIHSTPTCGGWYSHQVDDKCVITFRFTSIDGLTCVVNTNPSPDADKSPIEVICTYPVGPKASFSVPCEDHRCGRWNSGYNAFAINPMIDKKAAK